MSDTNIHALPTGHSFDGYRILRLLGAGGFGITYLAEEIAIGRKVAIKEYLPQGFAARAVDSFTVRAVSTGAREQFAWGLTRFRQEAATLVAFEHPNIVAVYRYFEANGTAYLVMQYVEGKPLDVLIAGGKTLAESEIEEVIFPILDGLEQVHAANFLHRDIKPANIYIRKDGRPVLLDFGAARQAFGAESKSITAIVSEGYAPFEQYEAKGDQKASTDIYALGAVLYRCITGERPPAAPERVSARLYGSPDPMRPVRAAAKGHYSAHLLDATERALSTMQGDRPQTIGELRALLKGAGTSRIASRPAPSARIETSPPVAAMARARKSRARLLAGLAAVLLAGSAAAYFALAPSAPAPNTAAAPKPTPATVSAPAQPAQPSPSSAEEPAERAAKDAEAQAETDLAAIRAAIGKGEWDRLHSEVAQLEHRIALALSNRPGHAGLERVKASAGRLRIDVYIAETRHHLEQARAAVREDRLTDAKTGVAAAWTVFTVVRQAFASAGAEPPQVKQLLDDLVAFERDLSDRVAAKVKELAEEAVREAERGDYAQAARRAELIERLDPAAAKGARERIESIRGRAEDDRERRERVQRHVKLADYHFEQARAATVQGRLAEARSVVEQAKVQLARAREALRNDPVPQSLKDLASELEAFQQDLAKRIAGRVAGLLREARELIRQGKFDEAGQKLDEGAQLAPGEADLAAARRELDEARKKPAAPPDPDAAERERTKTIVRDSAYDARARRGAIYFAFGSAALTPPMLQTLARGAEALQAEAQAHIVALCGYDQLEAKTAEDGRKLAQERCEAVQREAARRGLAGRLRLGQAAPGKGPEFRRVAFAVQSEKPPEQPKPPEPQARPGAVQLAGRTARLSRLSAERRAVMRIELHFGPGGALTASCNAETASGGQTACFGQSSGSGRWSLNGNTLCVSAAVLNLAGNSCYEISGTGNQFRLNGGGLLSGVMSLQ